MSLEFHACTPQIIRLPFCHWIQNWNLQLVNPKSQSLQGASHNFHLSTEEPIGKMIGFKLPQKIWVVTRVPMALNPLGNESISRLRKKKIIFERTCGKGYVSSQEPISILLYIYIYMCRRKNNAWLYMTSSAYLPPSKHTPSFPNISDWCSFHLLARLAMSTLRLRQPWYLRRLGWFLAATAGPDHLQAPMARRPLASTEMSCWYLVTGYNPYISRLVISPLSRL